MDGSWLEPCPTPLKWERPGPIPGRVKRAPTRDFRLSEPRLSSPASRAIRHHQALLAHLIDTGQLRVPIHRIYPLDEIQAAHQEAEGPHVQGKVVVTS